MLRTIKTRTAYEKRREAIEISEMTLDYLPSIREWVCWRIVENEYPYDKIAKTHHMLLPKEIVGTWYELSDVAKQEYHEVIYTLMEEGAYNYVMQAIRSISVPAILHFHLIETYDKDEDFVLE